MQSNVIEFPKRAESEPDPERCIFCKDKGRISAIDRRNLSLAVFRCYCPKGELYYGGGSYRTFDPLNSNYADFRATW
jgi:hypothetical protein